MTHAPSIMREYKVENYEDIALVIGWGALEVLMQRYAGRDYLYVPSRMRDCSEIAEAIGADLAGKLMELCRGSRIPVVGSEKRLRQAKAKALLEAEIRAGHRTASGIAKDFDLSARRVRGIAASMGVRLPRRQVRSAGEI